jgi:hypothetical protein
VVAWNDGETMLVLPAVGEVSLGKCSRSLDLRMERKVNPLQRSKD